MFITTKRHKALLAEAESAYPAFQREVSKYHDMYQEAKAQRDAETLRANALAAELAKMKAARAKGDANLRQNRKARPDQGADPYDTARDTRRDDREIHGL